MPKRQIDSITAIRLSSGETVGNYQPVSDEIVDEWRWGTVSTLVVNDKSDGTYWSASYQEQVGDNYHNSFEDEDTVDFAQVKPVQVVKVEYEAVPE